MSYSFVYVYNNNSQVKNKGSTSVLAKRLAILAVV
jgi:hypothetical protein